MAYIINEACISCGACAAECPVECISEGDESIECGSCSDVCPVDAPQQGE